MSSRMSSFQRRADKLLTREGWRFVRYSSKGYAMYVKGRETTTIASSPKNESDALKQVVKFAGLRR